MPTAGHPHHEPLRATATRNLLIMLIVGTVVTLSLRRIRWPVAVVLIFWPTFGGHYLEAWYLNWMRPRLPPAANAQRLARLLVWFVGGSLLGLGVVLTAHLLHAVASNRWPVWWLPGVAFIAVELIAHLALQARGRDSFYNTRG